MLCFLSYTETAFSNISMFRFCFERPGFTYSAIHGPLFEWGVHLLVVDLMRNIEGEPPTVKQNKQRETS